jgi:hypothetical protein
MAIVGIMTSQTVNAARFDSTIEQSLNSDYPKTFIAGCRYALRIFPSMYVHQNVTITNDQQLAQKNIDSCDNYALIIKLDVCPNHSNKFPICSEPRLAQYIHERGLDAATVAPTEWYDVSHPGLQNEIIYKATHPDTNERLNNVVDFCINSLPNGTAACDNQLVPVLNKLCNESQQTLDACQNGKVAQYQKVRNNEITKTKN